jgi:hypothetical protein
MMTFWCDDVVLKLDGLDVCLPKLTSHPLAIDNLGDQDGTVTARIS